MKHGSALECILEDFEFKPEGLDLIVEMEGISKYEAMRAHTAFVASNFASGELWRLGQIAQDLSEWHQTLRSQCSSIYKGLTANPDGPQLTREEANADPGLLTLQAVRRGVRDAMNTRYRWAYGTRQGYTSTSRLRFDGPDGPPPIDPAEASIN
jgi:hypothetical protein